MNGSCCVAVDGCTAAGTTSKMENVYQDMLLFFSNLMKVLLFVEAFKMLLKTIYEIARQNEKEKRKNTDIQNFLI